MSYQVKWAMTIDKNDIQKVLDIILREKYLQLPNGVYEYEPGITLFTWDWMNAYQEIYSIMDILNDLDIDYTITEIGEEGNVEYYGDDFSIERVYPTYNFYLDGYVKQVVIEKAMTYIEDEG